MQKVKDDLFCLIEDWNVADDNSNSNSNSFTSKLKFKKQWSRFSRLSFKEADIALTSYEDTLEKKVSFWVPSSLLIWKM